MKFKKLDKKDDFEKALSTAINISIALAIIGLLTIIIGEIFSR